MHEIKISKMPKDLIEELHFVMNIRRGECFTNCGYAVLGINHTKEINTFSQKFSKFGGVLKYNLGMMTAHTGEIVGHAWLSHHLNEEVSYWDPTLQLTRFEWTQYNNKFRYLLRKQFSGDELVIWLQTQYPNRITDEKGIPLGRCGFPNINNNGEFSWVEN